MSSLANDAMEDSVLGYDDYNSEDIKSIQRENDEIQGFPKLILMDSLYINGVPHTILTIHERLFLSLILGLAGIGSSFAMPVYWPALSKLAEAFDTTENRINYSITSYLVLQATSPVFISSLSDVFGRRPIIMLCLLGGVGFNIALACTTQYWCLILFRSLLALFVAPLISITIASVGDLTTKRDRGVLTTITAGLTLTGQAIAPLLGAVMETVWSWRAIFWLCAIINGVLLISVFLLIPETNRRYVGNLGVRPKTWYQWSPTLFYLKDRIDDSANSPSLIPGKVHYNPWKPLSLIKRPSVFFILLPTSIQFATWTILQTTLSIQLKETYDYTVLKIGLCFIVPGVATVISTLSSGRLIDFLYRNRKEKYQLKYKDKIEKAEEIPPFNIINCRLIPVVPISLIAAAATVTFGWCIAKGVDVAVVLVMTFLVTLCIMYPMSVVNTVLIDLFPDITGGVTALNNLFRCGISSIFVSCLSRMVDSMTMGGTYTLMMGLILMSSSLVFLLMKKSQHILNQRENYSPI